MRMKCLAAAALALVSVSAASASNAQKGYVTGFATLGNGVMLVFSDGARDAPPSCSNASYPNRWAFDMTTPTGQGILSVLLNAHTLHEPVRLKGAGECMRWQDAETLVSVVTNNVQ